MEQLALYSQQIMFNEGGAFAQQPEESTPSLLSSPDEVFVPEDIRRSLWTEEKKKFLEKAEERGITGMFLSPDSTLNDAARGQIDKAVGDRVTEWQQKQYQMGMVEEVKDVAQDKKAEGQAIADKTGYDHDTDTWVINEGGSLDM